MFRKIVPLLVAITAASACQPPELAEVEEPRRPEFSLATDAAYDFSTITPYAGDHQAVYDYIDAHERDHVAADSALAAATLDLRAERRRGSRWPRCSAATSSRWASRKPSLVPTDGHPGVWGYYDAGADKTLAVYLMYDVQPVNPEELESPPFEAQLIDHELGKVIMARGATNQKGPQRAFLNALESIIAVDGKLPVNIMIAAEGEEELGSPALPPDHRRL